MKRNDYYKYCTTECILTVYIYNVYDGCDPMSSQFISYNDEPLTLVFQ